MIEYKRLFMLIIPEALPNTFPKHCCRENLKKVQHIGHLIHFFGLLERASPQAKVSEPCNGPFGRTETTQKHAINAVFYGVSGLVRKFTTKFYRHQDFGAEIA